MRRLADFISGLMWAAIGGGASAVMDVADDLANYSAAPLDWHHIRQVAIAGAVVGLAGWVKHQTALAVVPPGYEKVREKPSAS